MAQNEILKDVLSKSTNRRSLLRKIAIGSAALGAVGITAQAQSAPAPADVVQFALNLEYLEAEFYSVATTGQTLAQRGIAISGTGTAGATTTQFTYSSVNFTSTAAFGVAQNIATDEINHVVLLRAALTANGVTPVAKPAINLDALNSLGPSLANQQTFLLLARIFEDIGVSAYSGAAGFLAGSPYLGTAARILAVEGEHVGNIRLQSALLNLPSTPIDGADIVPPPSGMNYFSTNTANGLCAIRTPGQVLYLAYGGVANATSGGFFPNGVNGAINMSSTAATSSNLS
jgi:Ferritin-like domain